MKNIYPKGGKGKIHPSPAPASAVAGGGGSSPPGYDALAVLKLLPAAILALTVAMTYEDKEVLAYLITRSIHGGPATALAGGGGGGERGEERPRCRRAAAGFSHRPAFDCGCFDCYTSFWSRWDCSPDRELIHQAIEAFEEHLACSEKSGSGKGRRRERKTGRESAEKGKKVKEKEKQKKKAEEVTAIAAEQKGKAPEDVPAAVCSTSRVESFGSEEKGATLEEATMAPASETFEAVEEGEAASVSEKETPVVAGGDERRRVWPDVMGMFKSRLWSLWSPGM